MGSYSFDGYVNDIHDTANLDKQYSLRIYDLEQNVAFLKSENSKLKTSLLELMQRVQQLEEEQSLPLIKKIFRKKYK